MAILDDAGNEVPLGERGEVGIRGPQVMLGYWRKPEETRQSMTADGYFRTGDIGIMDEQGYTRIVDRKKDMIAVSVSRSIRMKSRLPWPSIRACWNARPSACRTNIRARP